MLERSRTPTRTPVLFAPDHEPAPGTRPAAPAPAVPAQPTLPGLSAEMQELRQRVLKRALEALRGAGPLTGREIAQRLVQLDRRIDRHLVNSVLAREGAPQVRHDPQTGRYRLKPR